MGRALFERTKGSLTLNAAGRHLLSNVRAAMRLIDETEGTPRPDAPWYLHCHVDILPLLADALATWPETHAPIFLLMEPANELSPKLLRGDLDAVVTFGTPLDAQANAIALGEFSSSVYCSRAHPASQLRKPSFADLAKFSYIDYPEGELHHLRLLRDHCRQRVARVPTMDLAVRACARGVGLVCVPDFVVKTAGVDLRVVPFELPFGRIHLWFRRPVSDEPPAPIVQHFAESPVFASLAEPRPPARRHRGARA